MFRGQMHQIISTFLD
uniref:Uncharacterized protein n=1 Tax=Arundo donax TaxID=35708 RepID=A0A0A9BM27_ARUDO